MEPDIEISASARAEKVRFEEVPETETKFSGDCRSETFHERQNLPDEVEPGVTYSDAWVRWKTAVRIDTEPR